MEPITVTEKKNNQYEIVIKREFDDLFEYVKTLAPDAKNILLLTDSTVNDLYADTVASGLKEYNIVKYVVPVKKANPRITHLKYSIQCTRTVSCVLIFLYHWEAAS